MMPYKDQKFMNNLDKKMWGFADVWNQSLLEANQRPMKQRNNLWASELGKSPVDLWLKMRAVEPTNPPNPRSMRKFEAGNVFEWIVSLILKRAGILQESQKWSSYQYPDLLEVTGKADFIAGGKPDYEKWQNEMSQLELPDVFLRAGERIIKYFTENYPEGLTEMPLEIKSVSAFMFEALEKNKSASKIHRLQTFHYLKSENRPIATIVYICRDDLRMMEFLVENPSETENEYKQVIETITKYHKSEERPPLEKVIEFSQDIGKFAKNFNVAYSGYLTMLYGFKDQAEFDAKYTPIVSRWNRVMARIKNGDKMTDKNNEVIKEIEEAGYNLKDLTIKFVSSGDDINL
jgi:hypothetical protein